MTIWKEISGKARVIEVEDLNSKLIIEAITEILPEFYSFSNRIRPQRTRLIMDTLTLLGDKETNIKEKYKVYSHSLSEHLCHKNGGNFKNSECLFDLQWYNESNEPYLMNKLPLVVECEWNPKRKGDRKTPYSGIKYDFQKLLVSNADLRLMIFIIKKSEDLLELEKYFYKAINNYQNLRKGAKFLMLAFDEKIKGFHFTEFSKE